MMDPGHTEHSGCPVLEGEKWIATVWMREGVSLDRPQSMFDPSGGLLMDEVVDSSE
jgi:prolyl 4-hydroxylase